MTFLSRDRITFVGVHVSNGDPGIAGILGAQVPVLKDPDWRWFYTQQHGENFTWEVLYQG